ncbi:hypothetical protein NKH28_05445 [Mesorhizobium sp. M1227]|uniref:hypothetical protein n=1 Tax=unclassified Mesorhizobium TaxID=325217 RepID=UPI003338F388
MNIFELYDLASWYKTYLKPLRTLYTELHNATSNNASQPSKVPIEAPLSALVQFLNEMAIGQLSLQQLALLRDLKVQELVGPEGARWIGSIVRAEAYDPATTNQNVADAIEAINAAGQKLSGYATAVDQLGLDREKLSDEDGRITVRIGFRNDASIRNIKDWKTSADEWYQIVRGVAMMSGEAPEDAKVIGASTGSVILVLSVTYALSRLLATIAKHITSTAKEVLSLQAALENLRQQKILTKTMEAEFDRLRNEARAGAEKRIEAQIAAMVPGAVDGDKTNALGKAIQKLLRFGESGGEIDFVAPPPPDENTEDNGADGDGETKELIAAILGARNAILAYQQEREAVKLLSDKAGGGGPGW